MLPHVQAFLTDLISHKSLKKTTCQAYRSDLERLAVYLTDHLGRPANLEDVSPLQIAAFLQQEKRLGLRPSTLARRKTTLRQYTRFVRSRAARPEQIEAIEEVLDKDLPLPNVQDGKPAFLSKSQIERLNDLLSEPVRPLARRDRAIFSILLTTAMPVSYLVALDCQDYEPAKSRLRLPGNQFWVRLIPDGAGRDLSRYLREGRPELNPVKSETALFISQVGGRMSRQGIWQTLRLWGKRAQLPFTISPRLLQHSAVLRLWQEGIAVEDLSKHIGHANKESTQALLRRLGIEDARTPRTAANG